MKSHEIELPAGYHWDNQLRLGQETSALTALVWPNYLVYDSDMPEPGLKFEIDEQEFLRRFPVWGIRHTETKKLVAYINAVQIHADLSTPRLPDSGWRFAIAQAGSKETPNCLCLLVANVDPRARGLGFSQLLINKAKQATTDFGFTTMIAPVRPTLKQDFPFVSMSDYLTKRTPTGDIFDRWIDLHVRSGGRIVNVCANSVRVVASLAKWRKWTGLALDRSGDELLPQGLVPLKVDTHRNLGIYCEPNVWLRYEI